MLGAKRALGLFSLVLFQDGIFYRSKRWRIGGGTIFENLHIKILLERIFLLIYKENIRTEWYITFIFKCASNNQPLTELHLQYIPIFYTYTFILYIFFLFKSQLCKYVMKLGFVILLMSLNINPSQYPFSLGDTLWKLSPVWRKFLGRDERVRLLI